MESMKFILFGRFNPDVKSGQARLSATCLPVGMVSFFIILIGLEGQKKDAASILNAAINKANAKHYSSYLILH